MWFPLSTITALCVILDVAEAVSGEDELETMFRERSNEDWGNAWHRESHSRCREQLMRHMYWACEKDIYRLSRRAAPTQDDQKIEFIAKRTMPDGFPWISPEIGLRFIRSRRSARIRGANSRGSGGGSITTECCNPVGCTWEEYAEYCPSNKRVHQFV